MYRRDWYSKAKTIITAIFYYFVLLTLLWFITNRRGRYSELSFYVGVVLTPFFVYLIMNKKTRVLKPLLFIRPIILWAVVLIGYHNCGFNSAVAVILLFAVFDTILSFMAFKE